jgi:hypothetical protein
MAAIPQPQAIPLVVQTGLAAMPVVGTKEAPNVFDGEPEDLEDFLDRFEVLAIGAQLSSSERVKAITQYVTRKQKDLFKSLDGYSTQSWIDFVASLKAVFPSTATEQKYSQLTLESITLKAVRTYKRSYDEFLEYYRNFMPVAKWLLAKKKITDDDQNRLFWFGLHKDNRTELKMEMKSRLPNHDVTTAWPMNDVMAAAKQLYNPLAFDNEPPPFRMMQSVPYPPREFDADEIVADQKRLIDAAAMETMRVNQQTQPLTRQIPQYTTQQIPQVVTKTVSFNPTRNDAEDPLVDLVGKMAELNVNDKAYAMAYAHLWSKYPDFAKNMPAARPHIGGYYVNQQGQTVRANQQFVQQPGAGPFAPAKTPRLCFFCNKPVPECFGIRSCKEVAEYAKTGKILYDGTTILYPNGNRVPIHPNGMKTAIDEFLKWQTPQNAKPAQQFLFQTHPTFDSQPALPFIQEIEDSNSMKEPNQTSNETNFVGAYTRSQNKQDGNRYNRGATLATGSNLATVQPSANTGTSVPTILKRPAAIGETSALETVLQKLMTGVTKIDNSELLAISPELRGRLKEYLEVADKKKEMGKETAPGESNQTFITLPCATTSEDVRQISIELPNGLQVGGIWDTASAIVGIDKDLAVKTGHPINWGRVTRMQNADGSFKEFRGVAEHFPIKVGSITALVDAVITENAPYDVLLGLPWIKHVNGALLIREGEFVAEICEPSNYHHKLEVPVTQHRAPPCHVHSAPVHLLIPHTPNVSVGLGEFSARLAESTREVSLPGFATKKYKRVDQKVRPVATTTPEHARVVRKRVDDPLDSLPDIDNKPGPFKPVGRLTQERWNELKIGEDGFLLPEEINLAAKILTLNNQALAWEDAERGQFRRDMFPAVTIPTIEHTPWTEKAIPIPPGIEKEFMDQIYQKLNTGVYEPSNASYRSRIFTVAKKSGAIRIVHDLQQLNSVTIKDAGLPPAVEQYAEWYAAKSIYTLMDIYVGYDHRVIDEESRALTTFQTPIGTFQLTTLPMGWTNSVPIFQGDVAFILQDEYHITRNFVDDIPVAGPPNRYELPNGEYETIPGNPGIRRFVWEHLLDVHRILHRLNHAGVTVSAKKLFLGVPSVSIVGHRCTYEGRIPDESRIEKIRNWPRPRNLTELRGFLGVTGVVRIFIEGYAAIAKPLVQLTRKDVPFEWGEEQQVAMKVLKERVTCAPCLRPIDYGSNRKVILAVDSSQIAVGWILSQVNEKGKKVPARYGSITWNTVESRYSQPKLELYGLFRALRAMRLYLIGLKRFIVEMDCESVKGMLNNPDIQPTAVLNRWIAGIKLFDFDLVHVSSKEFKGPDGLSRRLLGEGEKQDDEDVDSWLDSALGLGLWAETWRGHELGASSIQITQDTDNTAMVSRPQVLSYAYQLAELPTTMAPLPRTAITIAKDDELDQISQYLDSFTRPPEISDKRFTQILKRSRKFYNKDGALWRRQANGYNQKVIRYEDRLELLMQSHDRLGHKGRLAVQQALLDRFWWPTLQEDVKTYLKTCHQCQIRSVQKVHIPPSITTPATLFAKVHIDTMQMPTSHGKRYLVQARDSLTSYVEWRALVNENGRNLAHFILEELLCRWGAVQEIVTDNGTPYVAALEFLSDKYSVTHIRISGYNSQANAVVERTHRTIRDALVKTCQGEIRKWLDVAPFVFWADRVTIRRATGFSPFYMAHGVEPVLPFDIIHATYLVPKLDTPLTTVDLIAIRARQLQRRDEDLAAIEDRVIKSRYASLAQFTKDNANKIKQQEFEPGTLVLVRNIRMEKDHSSKHLPRYFGPMVVITKTRGLSYRLGELDGSIAKKGFAGYRLIPYYPRDPTNISVTQLFNTTDFQHLQDEDNILEDEEDREYVPLRRSQRLLHRVGEILEENDGED